MKNKLISKENMIQLGKKSKVGIMHFFKLMKPSLISIAVGLFAGLVIMFIFNPLDAFPALFTLIFGGFIGGSQGIGNMLELAAPIMLAGLSVAFAFKTGLFNIGASGQMMMGALAALFVGILVPINPPFLHMTVAMLAGMAAGAIWGMIVGVLKALRNVNEVVASIMMNYIALYAFTTLVVRYLTVNGKNPPSRPIMSSAALPRLSELFPGSTANIGIFIAIGVIIIAHIIIHKTTLGFSLRASGFSFDGSKYAGMNTKLNIIIAMTLAGLFSGLGGSILYLVRGKTISDFHIFTEGFDGISVALLGLGEPIGALLAGLFLANLRMGGFYMQLYSYVPQIIDMIVAVIIYATAITAAIQLLLKRYGDQIRSWFKKRKDKKLNGGDVK
jgi:general nucleoside transport system permease protein